MDINKVEEIAKKIYGVKVTKNALGNPMFEFTGTELAMFAELIIQECIKVSEPVLDDDSYEDMDEFEKGLVEGQDVAIEKIKEHFGVEEQEKVAPKPKCSVCDTTENVRWVGGYQPYLCDSVDCIPL